MPSTSEESREPVVVDLEKVDPAATAKQDEEEEEDEYPALPRVILIMTAVYLSMFLVALVNILCFCNLQTAD